MTARNSDRDGYCYADSDATATQTATPTATATPPFGTLSVSGNLSFGSVKVNSTKSKKLKVKNKGKFPLQVMIGTLEPPFSVTDSGTFTLGNKKTLTVTVLFKPTVAGATPSQILRHHQQRPASSVASRDRDRLRKIVPARAKGTGSVEPVPFIALQGLTTRKRACKWLIIRHIAHSWQLMVSF